MWLKTSLIEDFFEHLSADGSADRRRVDFWKRYVPYIDDMYFALGRNARNDRSQDTKRLRNTMGDRLLRLEGAPNNNAFLMQMGDFIVVEFGLAGNASFIFKHDNLPFSLDAEIRTDGRSLWQAYARDRLLHMDGNGAWEDVFAASILRNLSIPDPRRKNPASAKRSMDTASRVPALATEAPKPERIDKTAYSVVTDVQQLDNEVEFSPERLTDCCLLYGVKVKRHSRNVFEVWANNRNPGLTAILERWGFHYNPLRRTWSLVRDRL
jgi:hypothetical protein